MNQPAQQGQFKTPVLLNGSDALYVQLAREIAIDHFPLADILERYKLSNEDWFDIAQSSRFQDYLKSAITEWQSATNTHERTKLKAAALMELYLEEAGNALFDRRENLSAKTEVAKLIARIAGMGTPGGSGIEGGMGEKFSIVINLGEDKKLKFERDITSKVIEGDWEGRNTDDQ
jgi:hypothetical protein